MSIINSNTTNIVSHSVDVQTVNVNYSTGEGTFYCRAHDHYYKHNERSENCHPHQFRKSRLGRKM
ncbi:predicted protein [Plenodomus lingam JN3]|uniref:Uncharacterized protein n=1 Tax=Leptosphaeria maculans (strain JN3 / isolate v23.1.3 / race Av1-4-5-6-7-8) TaxID=985895 RepID=E5A6J0_LEPMJ|nr:predicted protein [Plenodomus lingam JN3]CBX99235.1 predicted protein [Plenodomus lingam JN3]